MGMVKLSNPRIVNDSAIVAMNGIINKNIRLLSGMNIALTKSAIIKKANDPENDFCSSHIWYVTKGKRLPTIAAVGSAKAIVTIGI